MLNTTALARGHPIKKFKKASSRILNAHVAPQGPILTGALMLI